MYGAFDLGKEIIIGEIHFVGGSRRVAGYGTQKMVGLLPELNGNRIGYSAAMNGLGQLKWERRQVVVPAGTVWWPVADETYRDWDKYIFSRNGGRALI